MRELSEELAIQPDVMAAMARMIGQSFARLASWQGQVIVDAVGRDERPDPMTDEIADAYDFLQGLLHKHAVDDDAFERIHKRFGDAGTIDLVAISGYYAMLAMVLNVARTAMPAGKTAPFPAAFAAV